MRALEYAEQFGRYLGIADLMLKENGVCRFVVDGTLAITLELGTNPERLYAYAAFGTVDGPNAGALYARLLQANYFGKETGRSSFSLNPDTGGLFLVMPFPRDEGFTYERFVELFEEFAGHVVYWTRYLARAVAAGGVIDQPVPEDNAEQSGDTVIKA